MIWTNMFLANNSLDWKIVWIRMPGYPWRSWVLLCGRREGKTWKNYARNGIRELWVITDISQEDSKITRDSDVKSSVLRAET